MPASWTRRVHARELARALRRRSTPSEAALWTLLRSAPFRRNRFRRQHLIGPYIVDFFSSRASLIVEVDGPIHESQVEYDAERQVELEGVGYRVLRVTADQVMTEMFGTLRIIEAAVNGAPTDESQSE